MANDNSNFSIAAQPQDAGYDFTIVSNTVKDGVRYISATPSAKVCSRQVDIEINVKDGTIRNCTIVRGCPGNATGICNLVKGMKADEVITRLSGIPCGNRGTSCPDQLARILKAAK